MILIPKTASGKWSVMSIALMPILFLIGGALSSTLYSGVPAGNSIMEDLVARPALAISMLMGVLSGILAFILGLFAIIKRKETATLVYIAAILGGILIVFLVGELVSPH